MDRILESLQPARETVLVFIRDSLRLNEAVPEIWIWAGLAFCLFLLVSLLIWPLARRRKPGDRSLGMPPSPDTDEAMDEAVPPPARDAPPPSTEPVVEAAEEAAPAPDKEAPERFLERLRGRLSKTHDQLIGRLDRVFQGGVPKAGDVIEDLEEVLVTADLGVKTSYDLLEEVRRELDKKSPGPEELKTALRRKIGSMLDVPAPAFETDAAKPFVMMVVGVNGVGKTTSIGKLASHLKAGNREVMLVAADTFRAAAIEQLEIWSSRAGADFVKHKPESDPSAVVYDAMQASLSRGTDIVIVDTAGRLHTKSNLMEELKKVKRIMGREREGAPHEVLLVVDATTGQNAINQARTFHEALGVTGIILTKLDGTAKGGVIVGIANELKLPVRFIGIGERVEDLRAFDRELFLEAIFGEPERGWVH